MRDTEGGWDGNRMRGGYRRYISSVIRFTIQRYRSQCTKLNQQPFTGLKFTHMRTWSNSRQNIYLSSSLSIYLSPSPTVSIYRRAKLSVS